jgi:hypothetical protein
MPRLKNISTQTFDPQAISILDSALDGAWKSLLSAGQWNGHADAVRVELARHIFRMAIKGERDRQRLIHGSLARFRRTSLNAGQSPTPAMVEQKHGFDVGDAQSASTFGAIPALGARNEAAAEPALYAHNETAR